jgi:S1-C subfamily serine protease
MSHDRVSRRRFLGACTAVLSGAVAGCGLAPGESADSESDVETPPLPSPDGKRGSVDGAGGERGQYSQFEDGGDGAYSRVYRETIDSVVQIRVYSRSGTGGGTGFVYDDGDHIVTNQHVVESARDVYVRFTESGWRRATVVGTDVYSDLAVLSVDATPTDATPLTLRTSDPAVGTEVVAIGNPFGFSGSVSAGIVSGVNRTLDAPNNFSIPDAIQTDAPVNPGNSGGPLVTLDGLVAGVVNSGGGDNIGFAISASLVRRVVPELLADGDYDHSYMGVRINQVDPLIAEANQFDRGRGVYVHEVVPGGPSDDVLQGSTGQRRIDGVERPTGGDVIVQMEETPIPTMQSLSSFLALETSPGDTIPVTVVRDGARETVDLTLGARPDP